MFKILSKCDMGTGIRERGCHLCENRVSAQQLNKKTITHKLGHSYRRGLENFAKAMLQKNVELYKWTGKVRDEKVLETIGAEFNKIWETSNCKQTISFCLHPPAQFCIHIVGFTPRLLTDRHYDSSFVDKTAKQVHHNQHDKQCRYDYCYYHRWTQIGTLRRHHFRLWKLKISPLVHLPTRNTKKKKRQW